jgi:hypothetical protein
LKLLLIAIVGQEELKTCLDISLAKFVLIRCSPQPDVVTAIATSSDIWAQQPEPNKAAYRLI